MSYSPDLVVQLLPAVWDQTYAFGMANPVAPDPDMPRSKPDPKTGGTIFAHLADIRGAWDRAELPHSERVALLLRHGLGWTDDEIAALDGVTGRAVRYRLERGAERLASHLNGRDWREADEDDSVG